MREESEGRTSRKEVNEGRQENRQAGRKEGRRGREGKEGKMKEGRKTKEDGPRLQKYHGFVRDMKQHET
jgi:hypothetical protein